MTQIVCFPSLPRLYHVHMRYDFIMLSWLSTSSFKVKPEVNWTWTPVGWVIVRTQPSLPVQPHLLGWGSPNSVYCHASRRCLQPGKVMRQRYPDQVGGRSLVNPGLVLSSGPRLGQFCLAMKVADVTSWHRGHPWNSPKGSLSEWLGECHAIDWVLSECCWSTRMGARGHAFRGVGTVY